MLFMRLAVKAAAEASLLVSAADKPVLHPDPAQSRKVCSEVLQRFVISQDQECFWEMEGLNSARKTLGVTHNSS